MSPNATTIIVPSNPKPGAVPVFMLAAALPA